MKKIIFGILVIFITSCNPSPSNLEMANQFAEKAKSAQIISRSYIDSATLYVNDLENNKFNLFVDSSSYYVELSDKYIDSAKYYYDRI